MHLILDVQAEKLPFVLQLVQQLDGVAILRMENNDLPQIAQQFSTPTPPVSTSDTDQNMHTDIADLQNEIDDLFGKK